MAKVKSTSKRSEKTEGLLTFVDFHYVQYRILYGALFGFATLLALICFLPVVWMFLSSFKETAEMYALPPKLLPSSIDLSKVTEVWNLVHFERYIINTLCIIAGCLTFDIMLNGIAGYVLSKVRPKGSAVLEILIFGTMLLPGISMVPLYMTFVDFPLLHINMVGSFTPIWMMAGANAFNILLFRNFFNGVPKDYFEAAKIDGCSNIGIFFRIVLPMSKPIIAVVSILSITSSWNNFLWPYLMLGNTSREPVSVLLYQVSNSPITVMQDNQVMLLMMLAIIPPLIFYAIFSKRIMGGFNMSGIKG